MDPEKEVPGVRKPRKFFCSECKKTFRPHPRLGKRQKTCLQRSCQLKHRARYRKKYRTENPESEKECRDKIKANRPPEFWKNYRKTHPESSSRNRLLTRLRSQLRRAGLQRQLDIVQIIDPPGYFDLFVGFATSHRSLLESCRTTSAA
jgi:hypothetical protein